MTLLLCRCDSYVNLGVSHHFVIRVLFFIEHMKLQNIQHGLTVTVNELKWSEVTDTQLNALVLNYDLSKSFVTCFLRSLSVSLFKFLKNSENQEKFNAVVNKTQMRENIIFVLLIANKWLPVLFLQIQNNCFKKCQLFYLNL